MFTIFAQLKLFAKHGCYYTDSKPKLKFAFQSVQNRTSPVLLFSKSFGNSGRKANLWYSGAAKMSVYIAEIGCFRNKSRHINKYFRQALKSRMETIVTY